MVLKALLALLLLAAGLAAGPEPAAAHRNHQQEQAEEEVAADAVANLSPERRHELMENHVSEMVEAEIAKPFGARLLNWVGRLHPFAVHFPIALFPVSLVALVLARRRGDAPDILRALIVVAGGFAALATLLGWLNAGFALGDRDSVLMWHRWLGTALGLAGGAAALWAWRSAAAIRAPAMPWVLGLITLAMLVQGWLGGALIHGLDHLHW